MSLAPAVLAKHTRLLEVAGIVAIVLFAFWAGMGPHWDYMYPLHVDEYASLGYAQSTIDAGNLKYPSPFSRGEVSHFPEMGFHMILGFLKTSTGVSWIALYRIAPGVQVALLAFLVYAFGRRYGFGWAAALFVPLIPTSIRTLGPTFLVPISMAMIFIPVTLIILHRMEASGRGQSLWLLLVIIGGTLFVHPPTEVVITALTALYLAALAAENVVMRRFRVATNLLAAAGIRMLIPAAVLSLWQPTLTKNALERAISSDPGPSMTSFLGLHRGFFEAFGIFAVALFIVGLITYVLHRQYGILTYILPAFTGSLLWFMFFFYPRYKFGPEIVYERGWSYLGLFMAIFAGYGIAQYFNAIPTLTRKALNLVPRLSSSWIHIPLAVAGIAVIAAILFTSLLDNKDRLSYGNYYHLVSDRMEADFRWLGEHSNAGIEVAIAEPSLSWSYPPLAGPGSMAWRSISSPYSAPWAMTLRQVFVTGELDAGWLRSQGASLLYTCIPGSPTCATLKNSGQPQIRQGVYLLDPHWAGPRH